MSSSRRASQEGHRFAPVLVGSKELASRNGPAWYMCHYMHTFSLSRSWRDRTRLGLARLPICHWQMGPSEWSSFSCGRPPLGHEWAPSEAGDGRWAPNNSPNPVRPWTGHSGKHAYGDSISTCQEIDCQGRKKVLNHTRKLLVKERKMTNRQEFRTNKWHQLPFMPHEKFQEFLINPPKSANRMLKMAGHFRYLDFSEMSPNHGKIEC